MGNLLRCLNTPGGHIVVCVFLVCLSLLCIHLQIKKAEDVLAMALAALLALLSRRANENRLDS